MDLVQENCDMGELQNLACVSRRLTELVRDHVKHRIICVGAQYFRTGAALFDMLRSCDAVVSGSTALRILMPDVGIPWSPSDLDIYLPRHTLTVMLRRMQHEGYTIIAEPPVKRSGYNYSHVSRVLVVGNGQCTVDLVVSRTSTALSPIFQFHSTVVMNFVSADTVFCGYPTLTLRGLSMVNAGPLYYSADKRPILSAMQKYLLRGIRYVRCRDQHSISQTCKVTTRTLTDNASMWFNFETIPEASRTHTEVFRLFGILDLQWMLGGMPCGLESAFCRPRVDVVEENSSLLWTGVFSGTV